ncbi:MAG: type I CRISPR-associated protein Cas7 [Lachnospiraceae bacterium]|nr:type I CRISPR-associated protein Cas7 [Lachnospiraceae bacterium]
MLDICDDRLVDKNYRYEFYFDCNRCIPNMGSNGMKNILSDGRYFMSSYSIKHKVRKQMEWMGEKVLHVDDDENTPIVNRLIGNDKVKDYSAEQLLKMEMEYADVRLFGAMDVASKECKIKSPKSGPVTVTPAVTLNPVEIFYGSLSRSYDIMHDEQDKNMGSRFDNPFWFVEYGLFKVQGGINLKHVKCHGTTMHDLDLFFEALWNMFENDSSTLRPMGSMRVRQLTIWEWDPVNSLIGSDINKIIYDEERMEFKGLNHHDPERYMEYSSARSINDYKPYRIPEKINGVRIYTRS